MLYRESGQFKTDYRADSALFPIRQDRLAFWGMAVLMFGIAPWVLSDFMLNTILIPVLIFSLATIGLNILTGYAGQLSLGTGGFMGCGAYACYKLTTIFPDVNILLLIFASGGVAALVGCIFGLPSLRIKGFYLAVATLASQFFLEWAFIRIGWLYNYNPSGAIEVPSREVFGIHVTGPYASASTRYLVTLAIVALLAWTASNLVRGRWGRIWMAVRDIDYAAELIGIRLLSAKLTAFAVSAFYSGVAGAMMVFLWLGAAEVESFDINHSFQILFMAIIGGLGSIMGCFMGAAFILGLPILLRAAPGALGIDVNAAAVEHVQFMVIGVLIILILIFEPHGFARIWQILKEKLRRWPFPY